MRIAPHAAAIAAIHAALAARWLERIATGGTSDDTRLLDDSDSAIHDAGEVEPDTSVARATMHLDIARREIGL